MNIQFEEKIHYLSQETGKPTSTLLVEALEEGVQQIYKQHLLEAYLNQKIERSEVIQRLGSSAVESFEKAWKALEHDIRWGMGYE